MFVPHFQVHDINLIRAEVGSSVTNNVCTGELGHQYVSEENVHLEIGTDLRTDKSGKKFAPKAPARRPAAPASTEASARPSVDRQIQSQTPQPQQAPHRAVAFPTPSEPLRPPVSAQQLAAATPAATARDGETTAIPAPPHILPASSSSAPHDRATPLPTPDQSTLAHHRTSPASVVSQKQPSGPNQSHHLEATGQTAQPSHLAGPARRSTAPGEPNLLYSDFSCTGKHGSGFGKDTISNAPGLLSTITPSSVHALQEDTPAPAAKRRRVEKPGPTNHVVQSSASGADANIPLPITESNEVVTGKSTDAGRGSTIPRPANDRKQSVSTQAKRMQRIENEEAASVTDATRSTSAKAKRPKQNPKGKGIQRDGDEASGAAQGAAPDADAQVEQDAASAKSKRKKKTTQIIQDAAAAVVEEAVQGLTRNPKKRGRRSRQRVATPEGADTMVIAPSMVKMSDLCKDNGTGRRSEREKEIVEFERAEHLRKKQKQLQEVMGQVEPHSERGPLESADDRLGESERLARQRERDEGVAQNVPNTIIVNGQIQIDEDSLQIDRHAAAAAARADEATESIDENALTRKVNSASWLKRDKSGGWNELLTERFYEGLRMFGTDFQMISNMFPGRTRHKIKLKFVKEEKLNHDKIKATLLGKKIPVDLPEFEKMTGVEFDDPEELERDMEEDRKRLEEETLEEKEEMDNARKERDEQIAAERAVAGEESSAKENQRGKNKRRKGEKHRGKKGGSRKTENHLNREASSGGANVLGEIREALGFE